MAGKDPADIGSDERLRLRLPPVHDAPVARPAAENFEGLRGATFLGSVDIDSAILGLRDPESH